MEVLVIEDRREKYLRTVEYIKAVAPEANIIWVERVKTAKQTLKDCHIDYAVIDMQLPLGSIGGIALDGGIHVLRWIQAGKSKNPDVKFCINTSDRGSMDTMEEAGFGDVKMIVNSTMYNCTNEFKQFLTGE